MTHINHTCRHVTHHITSHTHHTPSRITRTISHPERIPASGDQAAKPWISLVAPDPVPAAADPPLQPTRRRPFIFVYELGSEYYTDLLQYRHARDRCVWCVWCVCVCWTIDDVVLSECVCTCMHGWKVT